MDSNKNPFLGDLVILPAEIRNQIFELAVEFSHDEVDVYSLCKPHTALAFVSKKLYAESIRFINACLTGVSSYYGNDWELRYRPGSCFHSRFCWKLVRSQNNKMSMPRSTDGHFELSRSSHRQDYNEQADQPSGALDAHHWHEYPIQIRYITGHLSPTAPTSVTVIITTRMDSEVVVEGGHARTNNVAHNSVARVVRSMLGLPGDHKVHETAQAESRVKQKLRTIADLLHDQCIGDYNSDEGRWRVREIDPQSLAWVKTSRMY